jgi:hypothetical protein
MRALAVLRWIEACEFIAPDLLAPLHKADNPDMRRCLLELANPYR